MNSLSIISTRVNKAIGATPDGSDSPRDDHPLPTTLYEEHPIEDDSDAESTTTMKLSRPLGQRLYLSFFNPWFGAFRWFISVVAASTNWLAACAYNDDGVFSPLMPLRRLLRAFRRKGGGARSSRPLAQIALEPLHSPAPTDPHYTRVKSTSSGNDVPKPSSSSSSGSEDISPRRSIRIRLYNEETQQKHKATTSALSIKSPTSPSPGLRLTKYPRSVGPPVPLLSRRPSPKTLILDLDETLIHSLSKGGRMSSGHMVEVKLDRQHAILYYVHKRPYCDEFLRKVRCSPNMPN